MVDVSEDVAMRRTAADVAERLGTASVVVANAGVAEGGPFAESDPATWRRVAGVNLVGSAVTARTFLPHLLAHQGYYLQVASLASLAPSPLMSAYSAAQAGFESFARALQAELAPRHVAVGIAYLNRIDTELTRSANEHAVMRELRAGLPWPARDVGRGPAVAARLATAAERRSGAVYMPGWLRAIQVGRAAVPAAVTRTARRRLPKMSARGDAAADGPARSGRPVRARPAGCRGVARRHSGWGSPAAVPDDLSYAGQRLADPPCGA
ncbi:SDR family NAD(P)-dependent oxidoreductase [Streptomyces sp. NPDC008139]|uniref:SDR family NAD(P)-dependent oxidoreductase n=1 Tax=Streptomyces sp. NPDC008139 TaxID=3364814 RepID=UPI0036E7ACA6